MSYNCIWRYDAIDMMIGYITDCHHEVILESGEEVPETCPYCGESVYELNCFSCKAKIIKTLEDMKEEEHSRSTLETITKNKIISEAIKKIKEIM